MPEPIRCGTDPLIVEVDGQLLVPADLYERALGDRDALRSIVRRLAAGWVRSMDSDGEHLWAFAPGGFITNASTYQPMTPEEVGAWDTLDG